MQESVNVIFNATSGELLALAQLVKRIGFREVRVNATGEEETRVMFLALRGSE